MKYLTSAKTIFMFVACLACLTITACGNAAAEYTPENETGNVTVTTTDTRRTRPAETTREDTRTRPEYRHTRRQDNTETTTTTTRRTRPTTTTSNDGHARPEHTRTRHQATTETTTTTAIAKAFVPSKEDVADTMYSFYADKGLESYQIAGIIGNAEVESNLEPCRGIVGGGYGLFQLMDCEQRDKMFSAFEEAGVGKYIQASYMGTGQSIFDSKEDYEVFMDIMLEYSINPNDIKWFEEIQTADDSAEAAEIFLVHYERAICGTQPISHYAPFMGMYYQATNSRVAAAEKWSSTFATK